MINFWHSESKMDKFIKQETVRIGAISAVSQMTSLF